MAEKLTTNVKVEIVVNNDINNKVIRNLDNIDKKVTSRFIDGDKKISVNKKVIKREDDKDKKVIKREDKVDKKVIKREDDSDKKVTVRAENTLLGIPMEKLNIGPRKKLIVLSLGGLLVHRVHVCNQITVQRYKPDVVYGKFLVFKRPFCAEFLNFCLERFVVGLWSSAKEHNIEALLSHIMPRLKGKLAFIWDQDECIDSGFKTMENSNKPIFLKDLNKLWKNTYKCLPWRSGEYSASSTLIIDDEPYKAMLNPPNTAIFPKEFKVSGSQDLFLAPKGELQVFLDGLAKSKDVPGYVKDHPFGQPEITSSHANWDYYSKIVRKFDKRK